MSETAAIIDILRNNESMPFVNRILNPGVGGVIRNEDGTISTHRMSAEIDDQGQAWAFPTIVDGPEGLTEYQDPYQAMDYNIQNSNAIPFDTIDQAIDFSKNYKTPEFIQWGNKQR